MHQIKSVADLRVKIFADGAEKAAMMALHAEPWIRGFTTNPTLMRKAGITSYAVFARDILAAIPDRPISVGVLADEVSEMEQQARLISSWAENVYVKIPITNTRRESTLDVICRLSHSGVKLNVTAILTISQAHNAVEALKGGAPACISVFAGRIADTGRDPVPIMAEATDLVHASPDIELIWASPRELLNIYQAEAIGCDIITVTGDLLRKLPLIGKDLDDYSLETVEMFHKDACQSGFRL